MSISSVSLAIQEESFIASIFTLITKLGFSYVTDSRVLSDQSVRYDSVRITQAGTFRLLVSELSTRTIGNAVTYVVTFDPASRKGLLFDYYLERALVHLVGVTKQSPTHGTYRECVIEIILKHPHTHIGVQKRFILKTNKDTGNSRVGVPWLSSESLLTFDQARIVIEILNRSLE